MAKRWYGSLVADKLHMTIGFLEAAVNLRDVQAMPQFRLHKLLGARMGQYAIDLGRNTGYRLVLYPLNLLQERITEPDEAHLMSITVRIEIKEVTNHYE